MTRVTLRELNDGYLFSCEGHAGFDAPGKDIVCAGVSALCMALVRRLEELSVSGVAHLPMLHVAPGELHLRAETEPGDKMSALLLAGAFDTVMAGLSALEEDYADYVSVT